VDAVHPRIAGLDVHKKVIWVAVRVPGEGPGERTVMVRRFASFCRSLQMCPVLGAEMGAEIRRQLPSDAVRRRDRGCSGRSDVQQRLQPATLSACALSSGRRGRRFM
jgi:hypothetical protein